MVILSHFVNFELKMGNNNNDDNNGNWCWWFIGYWIVCVVGQAETQSWGGRGRSLYPLIVAPPSVSSGYWPLP